MDKLEVLSSISRLSDRVVRILGQNPGKFTLQGTNTYLIGKQNPYILIDTGEGREEYIPLLESALSDGRSDDSKPDISDIILSHYHHDHVNGLPSVLSLVRRLWTSRNPDTPFQTYLTPRLHKFPLPASSKNETLNSLLASLVKDSYSPSPEGDTFHHLSDGEVLPFTTPMHVLHTPGHTEDSICLYLPTDNALYTADTVLGQGTAVFEDLHAYITSLRKIASYKAYHQIYPGHGPIVQNGKELVETYITHRIQRELQIVDVLQVSSQSCSTWDVVTTIYKDYPESLWLPAARGVHLHMHKLVKDGKVKQLHGEGVHTVWSLVEEEPATT